MSESITYENFIIHHTDKHVGLFAEYKNIKSACKNCIVFFCIGEFYEIYFEDALITSQILKISLTKRKFKGINIPMCGVPLSSYKAFVAKLVAKGYKVAICNQQNTQQSPTNVIKRYIQEIITPGVLPYDFITEDESSYNFALAITEQNNTYFLAWADFATGDVFVEQVKKQNLLNVITTIAPKEIIASKELLAKLKKHGVDTTFTCYTPADFINCNYLNNSFIVNNVNFKPCVSTLVLYALSIRGESKLPFLKQPRFVESCNYLSIDSFSQKSLEILKKNDGSYKNSLLHMLNHTKTSVGAKYLKSIVLRPFYNSVEINNRLNIIDFLISEPYLTSTIKQEFGSFKFIQRSCSNVINNCYTYKDLVTIKNAITCVQNIKVNFLISNKNTPILLKSFVKGLNQGNNLVNLLEDTLLDSYINLSHASSFIKRGYSPVLDNYCDILLNTNEKINNLQTKYRLLFSSGKITIEKNTTHGYYIKVPLKVSNDVFNNKDFKHIQSLANEVRFKSKELTALELDFVSKTSLKNELEQEIASSIAYKIQENAEFINCLVSFIARLDVFCSLATVSNQNGYFKPLVEDTKNLVIKNGFHPILKNVLNGKKHKIVANSTNFIGEESLLHILTAPNMSGKSTFLKQNAIIIIMAQIGCYVPAEYAKIGTCDAIYSRMGSYDDILNNKSSFMVEMEESAFILQNATQRSFIIFDELGRGTSSTDGVAILQAIIEHVYFNLKCKAIFTTHYYNLLNNLSHIEFVKFYTMQTQSNENPKFLYNVVQGVAKGSYGIFIAEKSGLPSSLIKRAKYIANNLTKQL